MNNKGFLLLDSLVSVFVVGVICLLCFSIFNLIDKYEVGHNRYIAESNERLMIILNETYECESCLIDES